MSLPGSQTCTRGSKPTPGWTGKQEPLQGWKRSAGTKERGQGASRPTDLFPSQSDPLLNPAVPDVQSAHLQPRCSGLPSTLSPSTAFSLAMGVAAGSHTWSDRLGSTSGAILRSVALYCTDWLSIIGGLGLMLHTARRWWAVHWVWSFFSPESTPRRQRIPLEDHLQTMALCTRRSGLHLP